MKEQLITFETAVLAKKKGFDNYTNYSYKNGLLVPFSYQTEGRNKNRLQAPTQSLLQKWLREVNNINVISYPAQPYSFSKNENTIWLYTIEYIDTLGEHGATDKSENLTYEDALEKGLREALKLIKL